MGHVCKFLNAEFKETLKDAHGQYTVQRAGKIVGSLGRAIDEVYHEQIALTDVPESYRKKHD